jgi:hypothetical protein
MIYLIGGAPRVGKSILTQQLARDLRVGWISTDLLMELLHVKNEAGIKTEWDASRSAITAAANWFFPYLERFIWGVNSLAEGYIIEGVDFLPSQVVQLATQYQIRAVFLGRSQMNLQIFDQFPGRSRGYTGLPEEMRQRFAQDVPQWSQFIQQECERFSLPYFDMSGDFDQRLREVASVIMGV